MKQIQEIQEKIENSIKSIRKDYRFSWDLKKSLDSINNAQLKKILNWEIIAIHFLISEGKTEPFYSSTDKNGTKYGYPSHKELDEDAYQYYFKRQEEVKNKYLIIRYNQIIWCGTSSLKHESQPRKIIDQTLDLLVEKKDYDEKEQHDNLELLKNAMQLSFRVKKYRFEELLLILKKWLIHDDHYEFFYKIFIIEWLENNKKKFSKSDLEGVLVQCNLLMDELIVKRDFVWGERLPEAARRLASKLNINNTKYWIRRKGKLYEELAESRLGDESKITVLSFLSKAMDAYHEVGDTEKLNELGAKYQEIQKGLKLQEIKIPWDEKVVKLLSNYIDALVKKLLSLHPFEIYEYLSRSTGFFPAGASSKEIVKKRNLGFEDFATILNFDINNNISQSLGRSEKDQFFEMYGIYFNNFTFNFLNNLFIEGIKERKITFDSLVNFLRERSWLGQTLIEEDNTGRQREYSWLALISPALLEFFVHMESAILSSNIYLNFVLPVDSLSLKIEGILRDFMKRNNINTITTTRKSGTREMYIDDFLNNEKLEEIIGKNNMILLQYVFTSNGLNIRNNVSHCFYRFENYSYIQVIVLILVVFRLCNYKV